MFVCLGDERKVLKAKVDADTGAAAAAAAPTTAGAVDVENAPAVGAALAPKEADDNEDADAGPVASAAPASVADPAMSHVPDRAKLRLLTRFTLLVQLYARGSVILLAWPWTHLTLPARYLLAVVLMVLYRAWKHETSPALAAAMDLVNWAASLGLVVTFRLQASNPYFLLEDYAEADEMELVLDTPSATPVAVAAPAVTSPPREAFAIGDDDDDDDAYRGGVSSKA